MRNLKQGTPTCLGSLEHRSPGSAQGRTLPPLAFSERDLWGMQPVKGRGWGGEARGAQHLPPFWERKVSGLTQFPRKAPQAKSFCPGTPGSVCTGRGWTLTLLACVQMGLSNSRTHPSGKGLQTSCAVRGMGFPVAAQHPTLGK